MLLVVLDNENMKKRSYEKWNEKNRSQTLWSGIGFLTAGNVSLEQKFMLKYQGDLKDMNVIFLPIKHKVDFFLCVSTIILYVILLYARSSFCICLDKNHAKQLQMQVFLFIFYSFQKQLFFLPWYVTSDA